MTRRTKIFAGLAALVVGAVVIAVGMRRRGAQAKLTFAGWEADRVARFTLSNHGPALFIRSGLFIRDETTNLAFRAGGSDSVLSYSV